MLFNARMYNSLLVQELNVFLAKINIGTCCYRYIYTLLKMNELNVL